MTERDVSLGESLDCIGEFPKAEDLSEFRRSIEPGWIERALAATGTATVRRRRLPAEQVVWLVIGMGLMLGRSLKEVVSKLDLSLPDDSPTVAQSSVAEARARLGAEPLLWLFSKLGHLWGHASANRDLWRGLRLYGADGTVLWAQDSAENRAHFGGSKSSRGTSGYPLVRLVALMALRSRMIVNAAFGPFRHGEHYYAAELWSSLPDHSLTIVDRGYWSAPILIPLAAGGVERHWLTRAMKTLKGKVIEHLGPGDVIMELEVSGRTRQTMPHFPKRWRVRVIDYQRKGFPPSRLVTSMLDAKRYPAQEIIALYHERWELETAFAELKTKMLTSRTPLRSKTVEGVEQEIYGLLIAYNLIRLQIERVADAANVKPTRISFLAVYYMICDEWLWSACSSPGAIPKHLRDLEGRMAHFILPARRDRSCPRAVKVKMTNYPRKRVANA